MTVEQGVVFECDTNILKSIQSDMEIYLNDLKINSEWYKIKLNEKQKILTYTLTTFENDFDTISLSKRKLYNISNDSIIIPDVNNTLQTISTVSKKEIVLALFQHGRMTKFKDKNCSIKSFKDHVGIRQNTVVWSQKLEWVWPDGNYAFWNDLYWKDGTPLSNVKMTDAFMDVFLNQKKYSMGCYTAAKLIMVQGVLDYYNRVTSDKTKLASVIRRLMYGDNDPLVNIEPPRMWSFEEDFDSSKYDINGKILTINDQVSPLNFVPGD